MGKGEKSFICILLIVIIVFSGILIYRIKSKPEYDQELYDEIYAEYETMLETIEEQKITGTNNKKENNVIHILANSRGEEFIVAGEISIPKIGINYPIVDETTDEYLKIAPTKLFGPDINEVGNLCLVGHNYKNRKFFSRLSELEKNDTVYLMNNNGRKLTYLVYDKYEVNEKDLSCTSQNTNGNIELTLITCTNRDNIRLVVKCRAIV